MSGVLLVVAPSLPRGEIEALLDRLAKPMAHRAVDGAAHEATDGLGLSLQHMAVTPEDRSPSIRQGEDLWVALDGRIDRRQSLADELDLSLEASDATLVAAAYRRWGRDFCQHLHGEVSGVVVEPGERRVLAFRDRMGVRPLYWHTHPGLLLVASEPSAILAHPEVERRAHLPAVAEMIANRHHERRETLWHGIEAVPLAHWLAAEGSSVSPRLRRYYRLDPWRRLPDGEAEDYVDAIREAFAAAVGDRLRSERPLGIALSGGIDSSSILGQAEQLRREGLGPREPMRAYHFVYPGTSAHERPYAEAVAAMWQVPFETLAPLEHPEWADPSLPTLHPDSFFDPRERAFAALAAEAKKHGIRSLFTGNAVDSYVRSTGDEVADALAAGHVREALSRVEFASDWRSGGLRLLSELRRLVPREVRRASRRLRPAPTHPWLTRAAVAMVVERTDAIEEELDRRHWPDRVTRSICADLEGSRMHPILASLDRVAAKVGTEVRSPWQDLRLVELLLAIPHRFREAPIDGGPQKPILRLALGHLVPEQTRRRVDHPHIAEPLTIWFFDHHRAEIRRLFEKSRLVEAGLVNAEALTSISRESDTGAIMRLIAMERLLCYLE